LMGGQNEREIPIFSLLWVNGSQSERTGTKKQKNKTKGSAPKGRRRVKKRA